MLKPVVHAVQLFLKGATGKDRIANQHLSEQLLKVQIAYDQIQHQYAALQTDYDAVKAECDRLRIAKADIAKRLHHNQQALDELVNVADSDAKF